MNSVLPIPNINNSVELILLIFIKQISPLFNSIKKKSMTTEAFHSHVKKK